MDDHASARDRAIAELQRLIDGIPVAMVTTIAAEYWDVPSSRLVRSGCEAWCALATGEVAEAGDHQTIEFGETGSG